MAENPKISVIIPTCNRPKLLLECVESILRSNYTDFEVLIVDQEPTQSLRMQLIERFGNDSRLIYLYLAEAALDKARNLGVEQARGEILVFADDDIEVEKIWLKSYEDAFNIQPSPGVVGGRLVPLWLCPMPDWWPQERQYLLGIYDLDGDLSPMREMDFPIGANFAVHHSVIKEIGNFDERIDYSYARKTSMIAGGDTLFSIRVKQAGYPIYYQPRAKAWHKISGNKLTKKYYLKRNFWAGVTTLIVLYLSESEMVANLASVIRWHLREIVRQIWHSIFSKNTARENLLHAKTQMRLAAACADSLGAIYASAKLLWTRELP